MKWLLFIPSDTFCSTSTSSQSPLCQGSLADSWPSWWSGQNDEHSWPSMLPMWWVPTLLHIPLNPALILSYCLQFVHWIILSWSLFFHVLVDTVLLPDPGSFSSCYSSHYPELCLFPIFFSRVLIKLSLCSGTCNIVVRQLFLVLDSYDP